MNAHGTSKPSPAVILVVPLVVALVLTLFAWPAARIEPRDLPIGVAGPTPAVAQMEKRLTAQEGAFEVHRYPDEAAARAAIEDREIYGATVATATGSRVLTSSAASPVVAQMLGRPQAPSGPAPVVVDVVSASRGAALGSSVLPLVVAGILAGALAALLSAGGFMRAGLVVAGSVLAGLAATAIIQSWLGVVEGDWAANAAALSLTVLAIGAFVVGMYALFGLTGAVVGALTMVFIGNPFSAAGSAPELLPQPVGAIGQWMPPGAGANLLRSTGYFDGAAAGEHALVLGAWVLIGAVALVAGGLRHRRRTQATVAAPA